MEHWAEKHLNSLFEKGIVDTSEAWIDFDGFVTKGLVLALVDKLTSK